VPDVPPTTFPFM